MASRGWFERFKKHSNLHNIHVTGESASADKDATAAYPTLPKKIIEDCGYTPQQICNVDETGLFWKRMPARTYILKEEKCAPGFKAAKDGMTLLLGGKAAGDLKVKPFLVCHAETPRAMKGYSKAHFPVVWHPNKKGWVTGLVFEEWFTGYFYPAVKEYCRRNNLEQKGLLILDNSLGHSPNLDDLSDNVQVFFCLQIQLA